MKKVTMAAIAVASLCLSNAASATEVVITTGQQGLTYNSVYGVNLASALSEYGYSSTVIPSKGSLDNLDKVASGLRYQAISVGGEEYQMLREADADRLILSGRNIAIGNGWCDNAMFKTKNLDIAEFIYFDHSLSAQQVQAVYHNSRQRMAERALNLQ